MNEQFADKDKSSGIQRARRVLTITESVRSFNSEIKITSLPIDGTVSVVAVDDDVALISAERDNEKEMLWSFPFLLSKIAGVEENHESGKLSALFVRVDKNSWQCNRTLIELKLQKVERKLIPCKRLLALTECDVCFQMSEGDSSRNHCRDSKINRRTTRSFLPSIPRSLFIGRVLDYICAWWK